MSTNRVLTLLTDFGERDIYVGVLKGAIAQVNPKLTIIDLTHHIPPQDLRSARFNLANAYPYFPPETVHVAVVDPGVGSQRRAIALQLTNGFLVGPDNGILSGVLDSSPAIAAVELDNPSYWRVPFPSSTFHGRDIFAPVGAYLASGVPLTDLGRAIDPSTLVHLSLSPILRTDSSIQGMIQYIDYFGNLVTNIPAYCILDHCVKNKHWFVKIDSHRIPIKQTYAEVQPGDLLALIGSHGWVEIAVNQGNAQAQLRLQSGALIEIHLH